MPTTALHVPARGGLDLLARRIQGLHARNKSVLIIATRLSAASLLDHFKRLGVDERRLFIVDAAPTGVAAPNHDPEHVHYVAGPSLLELIAKRTERILRTKAEGPPHVIIYDCDTFALHNPAAALIEVVRYVVHHLADPRLPIDFVIEHPTRMPVELQDFLNEFLDHEEHLSPDVAHPVKRSTHNGPAAP